MANLDKLVANLKSEGIEVRSDVYASNLTTYRLGGPLKFLVVLNSFDEIHKLSDCIKVNPLETQETFILGNGSNVIVSDSGFNGIVFKFDGELSDIISFSENQVVVGSGMLLPKFARKVVGDGYGGIEFYVGIPGSIGGAIVMNAGGHGKQTSDVLVSADVLSLQSGLIKTYLLDECEFSYRHSVFTATDLIFSATYSIASSGPSVILRDVEGSSSSKSELDSIVKWRRENQPGGRNIGSVFQNTQSASAGSLIEKCGLKGFKIGGAFVSEKHANFIQADEGAKASDVVQLIDYVRKVVKEKTGIELKNEVRYIGFNND